MPRLYFFSGNKEKLLKEEEKKLEEATVHMRFSFPKLISGKSKNIPSFNSVE